MSRFRLACFVDLARSRREATQHGFRLALDASAGRTINHAAADDAIGRVIQES